mmetsp:Transcript_43590/g.126013  ORF Transcript_43590/g.126013 Transcript_43590/m.126013 type:complete len:288 (+) Transcript_43590:311-1174(+)
MPEQHLQQVMIRRSFSRLGIVLILPLPRRGALVLLPRVTAGVLRVDLTLPRRLFVLVLIAVDLGLRVRFLHLVLLLLRRLLIQGGLLPGMIDRPSEASHGTHHATECQAPQSDVDLPLRLVQHFPVDLRRSSILGDRDILLAPQTTDVHAPHRRRGRERASGRRSRALGGRAGADGGKHAPTAPLLVATATDERDAVDQAASVLVVDRPALGLEVLGVAAADLVVLHCETGQAGLEFDLAETVDVDVHCKGPDPEHRRRHLGREVVCVVNAERAQAGNDVRERAERI